MIRLEDRCRIVEAVDEAHRAGARPAPACVKRHPVLRSKATPSLAHLRIVLFCGQSASYDPVAAFSDT